MPDGGAQTQRGVHGRAPPEPSSVTRAGCCGRTQVAAATPAHRRWRTRPPPPRRGSGSTPRDGGGTQRAPRRRAPVRERIRGPFPACRNRGVPRSPSWRPSRLFASKDSRPSRTASPRSASPQTASAASRVKPPTNTEMRRNSRCSAAIEEVVAPADRGGQRPLPRWHVPRSADEQGQRVFQAFQQHLRRQHPQAGRGELDGQRQPVEPSADFGHGGGVIGGQRRRGRTLEPRSMNSRTAS